MLFKVLFVDHVLGEMFLASWFLSQLHGFFFPGSVVVFNIAFLSLQLSVLKFCTQTEIKTNNVH